MGAQAQLLLNLSPSFLSTVTMSPALQTFAILAVCTTPLLLYRLLFHPLAKYPGPWLAKLTELYPLYHSIIGDQHITFWRLHQRYGDIVRYGPNQLSFNTSSALTTIYGPKANVQKSKWYTVFLPGPEAISVWTCIDKISHAGKRLRLPSPLKSNC